MSESELNRKKPKSEPTPPAPSIHKQKENRTPVIMANEQQSSSNSSQSHDSASTSSISPVCAACGKQIR